MLIEENETYEHPKWGQVTVKQLGDTAYDASRHCVVIKDALISYDDRVVSSVGRSTTSNTDWVGVEELAKLKPIDN